MEDVTKQIPGGWSLISIDVSRQDGGKTPRGRVQIQKPVSHVSRWKADSAARSIKESCRTVSILSEPLNCDRIPDVRKGPLNRDSLSKLVESVPIRDK